MDIVIAIGANLGERDETLERAVELICSRVGSLKARSSLYETPALLPDEDPRPQPSYLNGVVRISSSLSPPRILETLLELELELGRDRSIKARWQPRAIDLDIIAVGDRVIISDKLTVPHKQMHRRKFVLEPMAEVWPDWRHPVLGVTVKQMLEQLNTKAPGSRLQASVDLGNALGDVAPWIMGVLNVTPDSFSDGGKFLATEKAIEHGRKLVYQGAAIVDVGGESTGPGAKSISAEQEGARIYDVVQALSKECFVSVDTYKAEVAKRCLELGAKMINDVSALRADSALRGVVAESGCYLVLMYSRQAANAPHASSKPKEYRDVVDTIRAFLEERIEFALAGGISEQQIIIDSGMGSFISPNHMYSWELLERLEELSSLSSRFPMMIATSRKGFLGGALENRDELSSETALDAVRKGARIVRTHNVSMMQGYLRRDLKLCAQLS